MAWKSNGQRLGAYFCETNVRDGKTAKPIVSSPKYAIFSPQCCILIRLQAPKLNPKDRRRNDAKEHVSLKLKLMRTSAKPDTVIEACFKFWIYDQSFGKHSEHLGK